jgi:calcineurin-like phosphoesterase family protein
MEEMRIRRSTLLLAFAAWSCDPGPSDPPPPPPEVLIAAGDIADCRTLGDEATAALLDGLKGTVALLGDNAYESGTEQEYRDCYHPTWGRHKARTRPSPGNHEYRTPGAAGYFAYFGAAAGNPAEGWYSYDLGAWHVVSLNSELPVAAGSAQEQWLRADLAAHPARCTLAYWHRPRFSSARHGNNAGMQPLWQALFDAGADVVLVGHDHVYERFAPQRPDGTPDAARGLRQFTVGTGGRDLYEFNAPVVNSEVRFNQTFGVLELTLEADAYAWEFIPVSGTFRDTGRAACH